MFEKLLALLERFVAAHEALAFGTSLPKAGGDRAPGKPDAAEKGKETAEAPTKKTRTKKEAVKEGPDLPALRAKLKKLAALISNGENDECADKFEDMLEDYGVRAINKLADDDVVEFHDALIPLVEEYYDIDE